jgi:glycerol uptake facilitator protein
VSGVGRAAGEAFAEAAGTFVLVFFGTGVVHAAVFTGAFSGLGQIALVWGAAVALGIYAFGAVSGAHLNPAITVAQAAFRGFPVAKIPVFVLAQLAGAFAAAAILYALFSHTIAAFEHAQHVTRGSPGSERSAMVYGEYFPNPGIAAEKGWEPSAVTATQAALAEGIGTAFLAFFVFALTDRRGRVGPAPYLVPACIGVTLALLIAVVAPLTQAGFNPARDFGPRLFAWCAGWGEIAIPGPRGGFFVVYILAPVAGALVGAGAYRLLPARALPAAEEAAS